MQPLKTKKKQGLSAGMLVSGFLFFAFLMWCSPYSSDDLEFAALSYDTLGGYIAYILQYGNGRALGNACAIILSHSRALNILVKAFMLATSVVMICRIVESREPIGYLAAFATFVMIDPSVFGEVYVWTSGFSNYFPPVWMTLVIVCILKEYPGIGRRSMRLLACVLIFLLGVSGQLFIEHSSGVNLLLALFFTCISVRKRSGTAVPCLIWLIATLLGLTVMLLIPKLFYVSGNHTETYRSVNIGSLTEIIVTCSKNIIQLCGHYFGVCLLPVCFGAVSTVFLTRDQRTEKGNRLLISLSMVSVLYLLLSMALTAANYLGKAALIQHAVDCIFTVLPLAVWILAAFRLPAGKTREPVLFCLVFALISIAPLLVVTPIPSRVIYQSYVFVLIAALLCLKTLLAQFSKKTQDYILPVARMGCLLLVLVMGTVFMSIRFMADARDRHIRRELSGGVKDIYIFQLPYEYTSWDHLWSQHYAYGTGEDTVYTAIDFDVWMDNFYEPFS